jgi:hypothetical protein
MIYHLCMMHIFHSLIHPHHLNKANLSRNNILTQTCNILQHKFYNRLYFWNNKCIRLNYNYLICTDLELNHIQLRICSMLIRYSNLYSLRLRISCICCSKRKNILFRILDMRITMYKKNSLADISYM